MLWWSWNDSDFLQKFIRLNKSDEGRRYLTNESNAQSKCVQSCGWDFFHLMLCQKGYLLSMKRHRFHLKDGWFPEHLKEASKLWKNIFFNSCVKITQIFFWESTLCEKRKVLLLSKIVRNIQLKHFSVWQHWQIQCAILLGLRIMLAFLKLRNFFKEHAKSHCVCE